ncbi:hypothetical protein PoB_006428500 [Plakobranchus ocellatus]|uniref:Uncharacterized protein n=1 Tax=Plakobranchus ocellatus TaxID=259542 RepID=A0AAV4D0Y9_9GAST|nr:hypothetical protein PoB_006428500 [Plakobranchus ocellatus]
MGDFNAKVGNARVEDVVGPSGIGTVNERGNGRCAREIGKTIGMAKDTFQENETDTSKHKYKYGNPNKGNDNSMPIDQRRSALSPRIGRKEWPKKCIDKRQPLCHHLNFQDPPHPSYGSHLTANKGTHSVRVGLSIVSIPTSYGENK